MAVRTQGGHSSCADGVLAVEKADEATFYLSIATNFVNYKDITGNEVERSKNYLHAALKHSYRQSLLEHLAIYKSYMDRVDLDLGPDRYADVTTDMRVQNDLFSFWALSADLLFSARRPTCQFTRNLE